MAEYRVTSGKLRESADTLKSSSDDFMQIMEELKGIMGKLPTAWESEASDKFRQQFNALEGNFESYKLVITKFSEYLNKSADEYVAVEDRTLNDTQVLDGSALFS